MNRKEYKVKYEDGKIIPLEPIMFDDVKEGIVIFSGLEDNEFIAEGKDKIDKPILTEILEMADLIPESELKKLPKDLSLNLDHYLYGTPKRD